MYLDTSFFDDLARMGGAGDFAAAYVIGHEVGHHVQTLLGTSDQVRSAQQRGNGGGNRDTVDDGQVATGSAPDLQHGSELVVGSVEDG